MGKDYRFGVILDAGSSGTRLHIYRWLDSSRAARHASAKELKSLPKLVTKKSWTKKTHPGVSTFGERPASVGDEHLRDLLDHALTIVPKDQVEDTPIFLMATAGMRLLPPIQRSALLKEICSYAQSKYDFSLPDCNLHIQVIPGETEGLYGWIAANYLLGGFDSPEKHDHGKDHHTYGFLDMGGASAQIAFAPNATEAEKHANDLKLLRMRTLDGRPSDYRVFVATWLGFGMNQARHRYVEALMESVGDAINILELPDPCLPSGLTLTTDGDLISPEEAAAGSSRYLLGLGLFDECVHKTYPLLDKDAPCEDIPCLFHNQHVPAIDFDVNHFVGVSEFWHTTHEVFEMSHKDREYDYNEYQELVHAFCSQPWSDIQSGVDALKWGKKVDAKAAMEVCFKASWLINVLHDGIGIPRVGIEKPAPGYNGTKDVLEHVKGKGFLDPFQAVDKIDDVEVSWTLGKMVLYASGQIPPQDATTPVGFGSNIASPIPEDFQYAGSSPKHEDHDDDWTDTAENLLDKAPKKTTTFFFLIITLLCILYLFRKKDRRLRLYNKFNTILRRSRRPGSPRKGGRGFFSSNASKLFGRSSANYERVHSLEDGGVDNEFELHNVDSDDNEHSDSSEGSRVARSSGLATPKLNLVNFSENSFFDNMPGYGGGVNGGQGLSVNHATNAMDRSGLVVRTESRERLAPGMQMLGSGRRSRTGSPTRKGMREMVAVEED